MAQNYILLERIELAASAASVSFTNIPQSGYTDLKMVVSGRNDAATTIGGIWLRFNGLSTNLSAKNLYGTGSTAGSFSDTTIFGYSDAASATSNTFSNVEFYIPNYTSSNYKSVSVDAVMENNAIAASMSLGAGLWSSTAAITSMEILTFNNSNSALANFVAGSTFSLYGLAAVGTTPAIAPKATGGTNIQTDGTYWYHTFLSSGTFTPSTNLSCDYVVVGGGGGGGAYGGGGGAGGFVTSIGGSTVSVTANSATTVTVGAGGAGGNRTASSGNASVFSSITAGYGGAGGTDEGATNAGIAGGATNGSGGGGSYSSSANAAGNGTGGSGGRGVFSSPYPSGGGGGAGANGSNGSGSNGGNGGVGVYNSFTDAFGALTGIGSLSGGHYYFAGGGGAGVGGSGTAGTGGTGGGGNGCNGSGTPTAGTAYTGGGGGGAGNGSPVGQAGGSGIVIIRYAV